ncbi:MAG: GNAT family N-acetyltransferase [Candidatus Hermodarchaeota archaeon]
MSKKDDILVIRELIEEDVNSLKVLLDDLNSVLDLKQEFSEKTINDNYLEMIQYPDIYLNYAAIVNNELVGFLSLILYKNFLHKGGTALINELVVAETHRNKEIGKELIKKAVNSAKLRAMDEIEVGTEKSNIIAQNFYKKLGFNEEYLLLGKNFKY